MKKSTMEHAVHNNQARTHLPPPRRRVFMQQSLAERIGGVLWRLVRRTIFRWSPPAWNGWRRLLLRIAGANVGPRACIHPSAIIDFPWRITIGAGCHVAHKVIVNAIGNVAIGDDVRISQYAHLCAGTHDHRNPQMPIVPRPIVIGERVWIAADAFVGPGATIGAGSLLAARSSAMGALPAGMVCIGEPAVAVHQRNAIDHGTTGA
ncbi:MAG: colanic acid biosynthesis acetyltransferase WcaF [Phycisphaerales bacterium]